MVARHRLIARGTCLRRSAAVVLLMTVFCILAGASTPSHADAAVAHGLADFQLDAALVDPSQKDSLIEEVSGDLRASWVRTSISWPRLEPEHGQYDATVLANLDYLVERFSRGA